MKTYHSLNVTSVKVTKHRKGENSTFNSTTSKEFSFTAKFTFNTGSVVDLMLVTPRKEYVDIITMEPNYDDIDKAKQIAFEEYGRVEKMILNPNFLYARQKGSYVNLYGKSEKSPTGVDLLGGCSSATLADSLMAKHGKCGSTLSPTEDLRTAH